MFGFFGCSKIYKFKNKDLVLFDDLSFNFKPDDRIAVLSPPDCGKTVLLRMLSGIEKPTSGLIYKPDRMSWPVGFSGMFHSNLSGEENVFILSSMMGEDSERISAFVFLFSDLGDFYYQPIENYSNGMRARLAFSFSMAVPFSFYVADDYIGTGDELYRAKCEKTMLDRLEYAGLFFTTRNLRLAERFANRFAVISNKKIIECGNFSDAKETFYKACNTDNELEEIITGFSQA